MIVTLTANPSLDRTVALPGPLARGRVQRAASSTSQPGGKGVNVARVLTAAGVPALAVLPGAAEDPLLQALRAAGVPHRTVPVAGAVRVNLTLSEPDGTTTKVNEPGQPLGPAVLAALADVLLAEAAGAAWAVLSGSLPPGVPAGWYAELVAALRGVTRVALDTSGGPLAAVRDAGLLPDLLKPNGEELAELVGLTDVDLEHDPGAAAAAARALVDAGAGAVLATLGAAGALLVTADGAWSATPPPVRPRSTVGAGDSALAGYLLADLRGDGPAQRLRSAVAHGAAAAALPGSSLPTPADLREDDVVVTPLHAAPARTAPVPSPAP